jgi:hypothetical protein
MKKRQRDGQTKPSMHDGRAPASKPSSRTCRREESWPRVASPQIGVALFLGERGPNWGPRPTSSRLGVPVRG